jgi:TetR/AcrR family transcriptional regulator, cholesterol catabolism regulator
MAAAPDRRDVILHSAAQLFAEKGVAASTVREIADSAGILSGSLYHHFESKAAIVETIMLSYLDDLRERCLRVVASNSDPRSCLADLIHEAFATVEAHPYATEIYQNDANYLRTLPTYERIRSAATDIQQSWLGLIKAGMRSGAFRDDIPPQVCYRMMRDSVWLSVRWFKPTRSYPLAKLADDCTSLFLDGFAVDRRAPSGAAAGTNGSARPGTRRSKPRAGSR